MKGWTSPRNCRISSPFASQHGRRGVAGQDDPVGLFLRVEAGRPGLARLGRRNLEIRMALPFDIDPGRHGLLGVELVLVVAHAEQVGEFAGRLRTAQHQESARIEGIVHDRQHLGLQRRAQVDQHVAAADQIHPREGGVLDQVVRGKDAGVADHFADLVTGINFDEVFVQKFRRHAGHFMRVVNALAGLLDRLFANVGAKDLDAVAAGLVFQVVHQGDGDGIGFLARGAARHPDPDRDGGGLVLQDGREYFLTQGDKTIRVAEKLGDLDDQVIEQRLNFARLVLQKADVILERFNVVEHHAPLDAPLKSWAACRRPDPRRSGCAPG